MDTCLICNPNAEKPKSEFKEFDCEKCGKYCCNKIVWLKGIEEIYKEIPIHLLSGYIREQSERTGIPFELTDKKDDIEIITKQLPRDDDVLEKARKLLLALERRTKYPGEMIGLNGEQDYPLAYCQNVEEFRYYLKYLIDTGLINHPSIMRGAWECMITVDGWRAIESYKVPNAESEKVFVAMWFDKETDNAYNKGILLALEDDCGYKSIRIDRKEYLGKVDDEIIAEIRESRFIVADFTGQRHGVYFEAGFAQGLGLPVIWTCHEDHVKDLHFDTRQENHITWEKPEELREKLKNRIRAVIGLGPHKSK